MKKVLSIIMAIVFTISLVPINAFAATNDGLTSAASSYEYIGESVKETTIAIYEGKEFVATKIINPNDTYSLTIEYDGDVEHITGDVDYMIFKNIADRYIELANTPMLLVDCEYYSQSQYRHVFISQYTDTLYRSEIGATANSLAVYSWFAARHPYLPGETITGIASIVLGVLSNHMTYRVVVETSNFEVTTSYSPYTYLFHCYHITVRNYDQSGDLLSTETTTRQVVGG